MPNDKPVTADPLEKGKVTLSEMLPDPVYTPEEKIERATHWLKIALQHNTDHHTGKYINEALHYLEAP